MQGLFSTSKSSQAFLLFVKPTVLISHTDGINRELTTANLLLSCMSHQEICHLRVVCTYYKYFVDGYFRRAYRLDKFLNGYFSSEEFPVLLSAMASHRAVITGIAAFRFIDRKPAENLLDIICPFDSCKSLAQWFTSIGYVYCGSARPSSSFDEDYKLVRRGMTEDAPADFEIPAQRNWDFQRNNHIIEVTGSCTSPIADVLKHSHFSALIFMINAANNLWRFKHNSNKHCLMWKMHVIQKESAASNYGAVLMMDGANSWGVRYGADWMTMVFRMLKVPGVPFQYCVSPELLFLLRKTLKVATKNPVTCDEDIAQTTESVQKSAPLPLFASSIDNVLKELLAKRKSNAEKMGYMKPRAAHDVLDAFTTIRIFHLLREVERRHNGVFLGKHYYNRDAAGNQWLMMNIHVKLKKEQKPNYLCHWNLFLDKLAEEHISL
ncbi:hypothetical protein GYMLUDRAFT_52647 [Collybiopsis luxurians FD-317 M1]|nr:hypothetical protein GYMLUDRAFT_52647 [Collybiopsis luxurians FD-317 M1]